MSATTWPEPATELVRIRQPLSAVVHVPAVAEPASGGPRGPLLPLIAFGPSLPAAELRAVPEQAVAASAQSRVASAIVQLDAPATVGPPELALDPGADGAGGVAGCFGCWSCCRSSAGWSVSDVTVALSVEAARTSGAMLFASGAEEAAEFVTAWHSPPLTPVQEPSLREPRGPADTTGSRALAALVTLPVHAVCPWHVNAAPAADAADGPVPSRARLVFCPSPAKASAAPGPDEARETDCTWQLPVPPAHVALPCDVRGAPPATAPSHAAVVVPTLPLHLSPAAHSRPAEDEDVEDGPVRAWPATGLPVAGSIVR
jgi:hypothetical protein